MKWALIWTGSILKSNLENSINTGSSKSVINKYMQIQSKIRKLTAFQTGKVEKTRISNVEAVGKYKLS